MNASALEQLEGLDGRFQELWNRLFLMKKDNEVVITKDHLQSLCSEMQVEPQFVWDTLRKFEGRGLIRRGRGENGSYKIQLLVSSNVPQPRVSGAPKIRLVSPPRQAQPRRERPVSGKRGIKILKRQCEEIAHEIAMHEQILAQKRKDLKLREDLIEDILGSAKK